jgi:hypothetical protein
MSSAKPSLPDRSSRLESAVKMNSSAHVNLYSLTKGQQAIRDLARAMSDRTGNLPLLPGIYPDYRARIVRNQAEGRELAMARWGMPSPVSALKGRNADTGVTNIRNVTSPHWRRWLGTGMRSIQTNFPFVSGTTTAPTR